MEQPEYSETKSFQFFKAVYNGDLETSRILTKDPQVNINWICSDGHNCLHAAVMCGRTELVEFSLGLDGLDVNLQPYYFCTPFSWGCLSGNIGAVAAMLVDHRIDINKTDLFNQSPLWWAARQNHMSIVELLLSSGRHVETETVSSTSSNTAAEAAKDRGNLDIAELIEKYTNNPPEVTRELRKKLGYQDQDIARLFALVVYVSDGHLRLKKKSKSGPLRFFSITDRLPLELQMMLCNRAFGSAETIVKTKHSEPAFKQYSKE